MQRAILLATAAILCLAASCFAAEPGKLELHARARTKDPQHEGQFLIGEKKVEWEAKKTAIVVCDMWDKHWCPDATKRVGEMAPRMNEVLKAARERGVTIIHCPSDTMDFYKEHPGRKLAQAAPVVETKIKLERWCHLDPSKEAPLPIDDKDGGCDSEGPIKNYRAWTKQHDALEIKEGDAITDSAEAYYLMKQRGIENVIVMGVHTNMCVLGRPFSIRQMVQQGQRVVLMRDMTDTMYNPKQKPFVSHFTGTDLVVAHIEKYWCPTITSTDFTGKAPLVFSEDKRKHLVTVINESEYKPENTIPVFAEEQLVNERGFRVTNIVARKGEGFAGLEDALKSADLLLIFSRREALTESQRDAIKAYLAAGKPLIGLRTASHAFGAKGDLPKGLVAWNELDKEILGGDYTGHFENGTAVKRGSLDHDILAGIDATNWQSVGSLYKNAAIDKSCTVLLTGERLGDQKDPQPIAWIRTVGERQAKLFYTSLGHPEDFDQPQFRKLLLNAIAWAVK
jgi:nicotinamidase-related amidase/type 1 glutamine amidotransferase